MPEHYAGFTGRDARATPPPRMRAQDADCREFVSCGCAVPDAMCCRKDGWDYSIAIKFLYIAAFVVAIWQKEDVASGSAASRFVRIAISDGEPSDV